MSLMAVDLRLLAETNLAVQLILSLALLIAAGLARKRDFARHCKLMRAAVPVQIIAVLVVMLPSMNGYLGGGTSGPIGAEVLIHHTFGLIVLVLWTYINLVFMRVIKSRRWIRASMRLAFASWAASMLLGLHLYWAVYLRSSW